MIHLPPGWKLLRQLLWHDILESAKTAPISAGRPSSSRPSSLTSRIAASECPISHPSQLTNPFLGLPLESGKCESCGTAEHGKCEGHFGYIELPIPIYHPSYVSELKQIFSLVCLKCLRMKKGKVKHTNGKDSVSTTTCFFCRDLSISVKEVKTTDGALSLELRVPSRKRLRDGFWNFLDRFGFHYGDSFCRPLLPCEALNILKEIPEETRRKLATKGYFPQTGYIMQHLPVPPNCLYVPEFSDGKSIMSFDISIALLKRVLNKIEMIKRSRSGSPNFESHEVESTDLQSSVAQYMHLRGTTKGPQDSKRFMIGMEANECSTKQWLEKMRTLFIRKGSGFSSRSVITGDAYIGINVIGLPSEIAKKITFEERVTEHNMKRLQEVVDNRLCVTYRDGASTYAISVGSKGHTCLKIGQIVNRRIVDGDIVFINRPPSTHKHSLQAFYVYVHDDHTVKINPLICAPLGADFDGDCVHIFYPQSLAAKAEVVELFSVEKQLLSSHTGNLNLQLVNDSLLALKLLYLKTFIRKETAQQLAMFVSPNLPPPAIYKSHNSGPCWTASQVLQCALPSLFDSFGEKHQISCSEMIKLDFDVDFVQSCFSEIISSIFTIKGPKEALNFFNVLQPLLMETLFLDGFSISLKDFHVPKAVIQGVQKSIQRNSYILDKTRYTQNQFVEMRVENHLKSIKQPIVEFIVKFSSLGYLIDSKSDSAIAKVLQQLGFLGLQLFHEGKFYSSRLVEDCFSTFVNRFSTGGDKHPCEAYGLVKSSFYNGLNPYEELVHAISSREVLVRSSRGLTEPGTLFKNLMAILRDVVICYDGSVRNVCSNSVIQFDYGDDDRVDLIGLSPPGEPVGVLAATAISNPAYKAVLDSSQSNNSSWELMKEILLTKVSYKNDVNDRRVILYLNDCFCGKKFCKERAALAVQSCLKRVTLEDCVTDFLIEYQKEIILPGNPEPTSGLVGHIHLDKMQLESLNRSIDEVLHTCEEVILKNAKKKGQFSHLFKKITLMASECCSIQKAKDSNLSRTPCLQFSYCDENVAPSCEYFEGIVQVLANTVYPTLLDTIVKGDPRVHEAKVVWVGPDATSWVRNSSNTLKGELAVEMVIEKSAAPHNGDAWRTAMDACLPVMRLIDARRSIPYGVQQIRELFGISCAFDQAVERMSTSIRKVAKGVLKDHLILVAIQVPFTEATLFTPMKCFERAAEKCHSDSLDSGVSSCSWGKHVALGTGSSFQIIWDKKQMANDKDIGKGLYDFLVMVRTSGDQREANGACLEDVDDLEEENDEALCLSPQFDDGFTNPTFEETFEGEVSFWKGSIHENGKINNSSWDKPRECNFEFEKEAPPESWRNGRVQIQVEMQVPGSQGQKSEGNQLENSANAKRWDDKKASDHANETWKSDGWGSSNPTKWGTQTNHSDSSDKKEVDDQWISLASKSNVWASQKSEEKLSHENRWNDNVVSDHANETWKSDGWCSANPTNWGIQKNHPESCDIREIDDQWNSNVTSKPNVWDSQKSEEKLLDANRWNDNKTSDNDSQTMKSDGWGPNKSDGWGSSNKSDGWGSSNKSDGWGSSLNPQNRKGQKNQSKRPPRKPDEAKGGTIGFTSTGRRLDSFTAEEEKILVEVEPTMHNIKRILRDSSDGEKLSEDDGKFITEKVFEYHPDKLAKVSDKIDYIMVDKHQQFQESRCFYVVSCDGSRADFSYLKCMENFVRSNFAENADSFTRKYFRKHHSEQVNADRAIAESS
uniref:DNA-directed RNA polymerase subunit n=1 Tax=Ananas comosus var. bracteatus TaxID=296719 RepID=A0A6V7P9B1_ANACO|nr:unnamed protein product [Ananas comosus var. bracteatus]